MALLKGKEGRAREWLASESCVWRITDSPGISNSPHTTAASGVRNVIFNNCYQNFGTMNATTMAAILRAREQ